MFQKVCAPPLHTKIHWQSGFLLQKNQKLSLQDLFALHRCLSEAKCQSYEFNQVDEICGLISLNSTGNEHHSRGMKTIYTKYESNQAVDASQNGSDGFVFSETKCFLFSCLTERVPA